MNTTQTLEALKVAFQDARSALKAAKANGSESQVHAALLAYGDARLALNLAVSK